MRLLPHPRRGTWLLAAAAALICTESAIAAEDPAAILAELLKDYQDYDLQLPPAKARLVRFELGGGGIINGTIQPPSILVAFESKSATKSEPAILLSGLFNIPAGPKFHLQEVKPDLSAVKDINLGPEEALALAIHSHALGWSELAQGLLARTRNKDDDVPPRKRLGQMAWNYWESFLSRPNSERSHLPKRFAKIMSRNVDLNTPYQRSLIVSLDLALIPSKAQPGSIEALIDGLVDYDSDTGTIGGFESGPAFWRIAELGFDAVPALLEHLDDQRLTRASTVGFNNFPGWHMSVRDVVGDLLEGIAAEELTRGDENEDVGGGWLRRLQGYRITKAAASGWWEKARKESEEAYLLKRVIPPKPTNADRVFVNPHLLRVIAAKYPKNVPALYRTVLDERPDLDSASLAETLARCRAPAKDTLDLLSSAASNSPMEHRLPALFALKDVDKKQFDKLLLATIQGFPTDIRGKYWLSREAGIASLAIEVEDSRVWTTLEKVAKRSAVGLRMELLHSFGDSRELRWRVERLRLLASFLDDLELRDQETDVRFGGPCAGFLYPRVEVRDFAAEALSSLLGIELELKLDRTPTEWAKVRADVQTALNRELANGK